MNLRKFTISFILICIMLFSAACGAEDVPAQSPADMASGVTAPEQNNAVPIDPTAGISPYYKDPSSLDSDDSNPTSASDDSDRIVAEVYNETPSDETIPVETEVIPERVFRDVYVATYGNDNDDGTSEHPFRTIQRGLDAVSPGYTVYLKTGIYYGKSKFTNSGTEEAPIQVAAEPLQNVIVTLGYGEDGAIFDLNGQSNIIIRELRIGYSRADWVYGIYMSGGEHNVTVTDNDICNLATYNRYGWGYGGAYAVLMYGQGPTEEMAISNISIDNNRIYTIETGNCEAVAASGNCSDINISSNIIYDIMNIGIDLYGNADYCTDPALDQPRNCTITKNTVYQCFCPNYAIAGIYIDGARDVDISENVIYENMYGIVVCCEHRDDNYPVKNISVSQNYIHDNHDGGIAFGGYDITLSGLVTESSITKNTLYNNGVAANDGWNGEIDIEKCSNITIADNEVIAHDYQYPVIGSTKSIDFVHGITFNNNLYKTGAPEKIKFCLAGASYTGLDAWNEATGATDISSQKSN